MFCNIDIEPHKLYNYISVIVKDIKGNAYEKRWEGINIILWYRWGA